MGAILSYSIVSSILLALLYLTYKFSMAGERQFAFNRIMIFVLYAISLLMPALYPQINRLISEAPDMNSIEIGEISNLVLPTIVPEEFRTPLWIQILLWVYLLGVVITFLRFVISILMIFYIVLTKERIKLPNGYILVIADHIRYSPFSFLRFIVVSKQDYENLKKEILTHELTHLKKFHWIDQIVANLAAIFMWYNPAAWLMIEELKSIQEYQADEAVISSGIDIKHYQYLLIEKAVGKRFPSPANSLNHSKLKKRIIMMYKSKPSVMRRMASLAVIPVTFVTFAITDTPTLSAAISDIENARLSDKVNNNLSVS